MIDKLEIKGGPCHTLEMTFRMNLSDHALSRFTISRKAPLSRGEKPIPSDVFRFPSYKFYHGRWMETVDLDNLAPGPRRRAHKLIIRQAAKDTVDWQLLTDETSSFSSSTILLAISRAVIDGNRRTLQRIAARHPRFAKFIDLTGDVPAIAHPMDFDILITTHMRRRINTRDASNKNQNSKDVPFRRARRNRRKKLWCKFDRRLTLSAIEVVGHDGAILTIDDPNKREEILNDHWAEVFDSKPVDLSNASPFLDKYVIPLALADIPSPNVNDYLRMLRSVNNSSPGLDGIPYACWACSGKAAAVTLLQYGQFLCSGGVPDLEFQDSILALPPKGKRLGDLKKVVRMPSQTRPLNMRNSDNKTIASVFNAKIKHHIAPLVPKSQNGFVPGRQLVQNILDIDSAGRIAALQAEASWSDDSMITDVPAMVFFDFKAAFPSVSHDWLRTIIDRFELPLGFMSYVESSYSVNTVHGRIGGELAFAIYVRAGVLQGDHLAGTLFVLAVWPFLLLMERKIDKVEVAVTRACADDVATVVRGMATLMRLAMVFTLVKQYTNMVLNIAKCVVVPCFPPMSVSLRKRVAEWIASSIPTWNNIKVASSVEYLGIHLGPETAARQWQMAQAKWISRATAIASEGLPPSLTVALYQARAVSTLTYKLQILDPPKSLLAAERHVINKLLHLPGNALKDSFAHSLSLIGAPEPSSIKATGIAAKFRMTVATEPQVFGLRTSLERANESWTPLDHRYSELH